MAGVRQSPWIIHYDASSCNGCDIETLACLTPGFDVERLGVVNTGNPKHADIFLVTGAVNEQCRSVIQNIYSQMPEPKVVIAVGACASSGGIFRDCYNISGGVDTVIPVDVYVPGCAARPEAIIDGVVKGIEVLEAKQKRTAFIPGSLDEMVFAPSDKSDAAELLALQRIAFLNEAALYGEAHTEALHQTLEHLEAELEESAFVKVHINGKIIGAARGVTREFGVEIGRIMVHPYYRKRGIGQRLLQEIEALFPTAKRLEAFVSHKSESTLRWMERQGYRTYKEEPVNTAVTRIWLQKERS